MDELHIVLLNRNAELNYFSSTTHRELDTDSGFDLFFCDDAVTVKPGQCVLLGMGIAAELFSPVVHGYDLLPRSSISKTPLIMVNSPGLIDYGYRGEIKAAVRNLSTEDFTIIPGTRLFQLCMPSKVPFNVKIVEKLSETKRGSGGFGSTGSGPIGSI